MINSRPTESELTWEGLAKDHAGLVAGVVNSLGIKGEAAKDMLQEGLLCLRKVPGRFDPSRNVALSTYLNRVVIRHIVKTRKSQHVVRIPNSTMDKVEALRKRPDAPRPSAETMTAIGRTLRMRRDELDDVHPGSEDTPSRIAERHDEAEHLRRAVLQIPARPRQVLIRLYGLFGNDQERLIDVARDLELTQKQVAALRDQAIAILQETAIDPNPRVT